MTFESAFYLSIAAICTWYPLSLFLFGGKHSSVATTSLRRNHYKHAVISVCLAHMFMVVFLYDMTVGINDTAQAIAATRQIKKNKPIAVSVSPMAVEMTIKTEDREFLTSLVKPERLANVSRQVTFKRESKGDHEHSVLAEKWSKP